MGNHFIFGGTGIRTAPRPDRLVRRIVGTQHRGRDDGDDEGAPSPTPAPGA
ncbi:MAG: hypothetical protein AVDCRST_MAG19-176 [uncultured Thermomicrobiales bacterium]|uniref:Uncharacterized protein n=1 Tax=uncultured Thermomicrobiales bacterium TaxID=1645740 RepID=A0A6J4U9M4_9BACT|nr:MAG: hypothetical protein AVDCRST_MAG19-176 [uncultured Thermomicrobiales bacterium]